MEGPKREGAVKGGHTHHGESGRCVSRRVRVTGLSENCASCSAATALIGGGGPASELAGPVRGWAARRPLPGEVGVAVPGRGLS